MQMMKKIVSKNFSLIQIEVNQITNQANDKAVLKREGPVFIVESQAIDPRIVVSK